MRQRNIGDQQQIYIGNLCLEGVIDKIFTVDGKDAKGVIESYSVEGYGITQDFWYPDGTMLAEHVERRKSLSLMPPEYVYKRARDFDWTVYLEDTAPQKRVANAFVTQFDDFRRQGRGLYIFSETKGSGKTLLACCIANEILACRDISVKFVSVTEYIELIKSKNEADREVTRSIFDCGLLILDDIGAEASEKDWIRASIFRLVDYRDKNMLSTIYTSNYKMESLPGDDRTLNRILGHSIPVPMPELSVRSLKARKKTDEFLKKVLNESQEDVFAKQ